MPKDTFFNLPEEKREQVFRAAVDEFAAHPFEQASINRIVRRAGIAKGSFYQYFGDKKDLFVYLLKRVGEERMIYLRPAMENADQRSFFGLLRSLYLAGIRFAVEHPRYAEISRKLLSSRGTPVFGEVMRRSTVMAQELFEDLLQKAIQRGEVRENIDTKLLAYLIPGASVLIVEYYLENVSPEYDEGMMTIVDQFIDLLRSGIAAGTNLG